MQRLRGQWEQLFTAGVSTEQLMRRERWTLDILSLTLYISLAAAALISVAVIARIFQLAEVAPIYIVLVITAAAWWSAKKDRWRWASYVPTMICFLLGAYGSYVNGITTTLILFYALSILVAGVLQGSTFRWLLVVVSTITHFGLGWYGSSIPFLDILSSVITVFFSFLAVAAVQWYFDTRLQHLLAGQFSGNLALKDEIARRRLVEAVQQEQETQLQRLTQNVTDMIAELDMHGIFKYASPSYLSGLGFSPHQLLGKSAFDLVHPDDLQIAMETAQLAAASGNPQRMKVRSLRADGSYLYVEIYGRALISEKGELQGFIYTMRDISQQVKIEAALQESERKFRNIIESIPLGIHVYALDDSSQLVFTDYNPAADSITKAQHATLVGKPIDEAFPGLAGTPIPAAFSKIAREGGAWHNEHFTYADNRISGAFDVLAFQTLPGSVVTVFTDISERLKTATALRQSEERFSKAFHTTPDSVNINRRSDGLYLEINHGFTKLMGYTAEDVSGKSSLDLNIWADPADRERLVAGLRKAGVVENLEARFRRKSGDIGIGLMSARIIDINGESCILSITRDITERHEAEINLRKAHKGLEQAYEATLKGWARALELRERETANHSRRVVEMTLAIARKMGMCDQELENIQRGALLHDIGKLGVPDNILRKPGPLTDEEWVIMRQHPQYAYNLIKDISYLLPTIDIPYYHHERWDGSGYPRGLKGEEIPLAARIFAVVDVWDALLSDRPYRPAWPLPDVLRYLEEQKSMQFDPQVVDHFLGILNENGMAELSPEI